MTLYSPRSFTHLLGTAGFSDKILKDHFSLYEGYVTNTNKLLTQFEKDRKAETPATPEYAELKRRFGWEFNGMRLHEIYFDNLSRESRGSASGDLKKQLDADFGSYDKWVRDFKATGAMRGIGWAAVYWDPIGKRVMNSWLNEHDRGELAGCPMLLLMDVFEHAFMTDYGTKRADYIEAFFAAIDWERVQARFEGARRMEPVSPAARG
jgi:Fe-Mn family superoxide dismutase